MLHAAINAMAIARLVERQINCNVSGSKISRCYATFPVALLLLLVLHNFALHAVMVVVVGNAVAVQRFVLR